MLQTYVSSISSDHSNLNGLNSNSEGRRNSDSSPNSRRSCFQQGVQLVPNASLILVAIPIPILILSLIPIPIGFFFLMVAPYPIVVSNQLLATDLMSAPILMGLTPIWMGSRLQEDQSR